jgi:ketosteroid isomerase-like protein
MSQENVEIMQAVFETWNAGDMSSFFELFHPDVIYRNREDEPDVRLYRGLEDFRGYVASWLEMFDDLRYETHDFIDLGDEVIAVTHLVGRGRETETDVRGSYVFRYRFRDGMIIEGREYATKEEALEAAGLSEQDAHADS